MPTYVIYTTTTVHAVFDALADISTGISLNSTLMVGPTVHPPLIDVISYWNDYRCESDVPGYSHHKICTDLYGGIIIKMNR
jgi:hypothetical protein